MDSLQVTQARGVKTSSITVILSLAIMGTTAPVSWMAITAAAHSQVNLVDKFILIFSSRILTINVHEQKNILSYFFVKEITKNDDAVWWCTCTNQDDVKPNWCFYYWKHVLKGTCTISFWWLLIWTLILAADLNPTVICFFSVLVLLVILGRVLLSC